METWSNVKLRFGELDGGLEIYILGTLSLGNRWFMDYCGMVIYCFKKTLTMGTWSFGNVRQWQNSALITWSLGNIGHWV